MKLPGFTAEKSIHEEDRRSLYFRAVKYRNFKEQQVVLQAMQLPPTLSMPWGFCSPFCVSLCDGGGESGCWYHCMVGCSAW